MPTMAAAPTAFATSAQPGLPRPVAAPPLMANGILSPQTAAPTAMVNSMAPPPIQAPNIHPMAPQPPFGFIPPSSGTFGGKAPTSTPYGDFNAPDPTTFAHSPDYQYLQDAQAKARQRSAAAHGTLLTGGTVKALQQDSAGIAAGDYGNAYNRALQSYTANRDTNAQNFGQLMGTYNADLAGFNANTAATQGAGRLGLESATASYDRNYGAARDAYHDQTANTLRQTDIQNGNADRVYAQQQDDYARRVAESRAQNAAINEAASRRTRTPSVTRWG